MKRRTPHQKLMDTLESIAWGCQEFGSLLPGGKTPRSAIMKAVNLGLARSEGMVTVMTPDGFSTNRTAEGFSLSAAGWKMHREHNEKLEKESLARLPKEGGDAK